MRPRKQVDLTNVEIDFTNVKTRSAHNITSSTSNTADAHSSAIASLLNADAYNHEGGDNSSNNNKEQLILQAYDPAMQGYVNRHTQQVKGRRRHLFSSSLPSSSLKEQSMNTEETKATSKANEQSITNKSNIDIINGNKKSEDGNTAIDFIREVDSITNAAQEQQRLLTEYKEKLKTFCQDISNTSNSNNHTSSHSEETLTHEQQQQQQNQQLLEQEEKLSNTKMNSSAFPACFTTTTTTNNSFFLSRHSLISHLFADGVPDVEP